MVFDDFQFWRRVLVKIRTLIIQDPEKFYVPESFLQQKISGIKNIRSLPVPGKRTGLN
jgi:hypothetical protein